MTERQNASESDPPAPNPKSFPRRPAPEAQAALRARLSAWYVAEARDLPWRRTRDPYAIWLSEAMLQQTRVETVREYWTRFLERLPTVGDLAQAPEQEVLTLWSGLGYYRRARSLHAAARVIVADHGGIFPSTRAAALSLPGVGPYTAGAVLSIAYDLPEALVDGNVERVFSRLFGLEAPSTSPRLTRECWELANLLIPRSGGAGDWNQALMELGATICTARKPACGRCPVKDSCVAGAHGDPESLPLPRPRKKSVEVELKMLLITRPSASAGISASAGGRVPPHALELLLERRPSSGRMANMWQLPTVELPQGARLSGLFPPEHLSGVRALLDPALPEVAMGSIRHSITNHRIRAHVLATGPAPASPQVPALESPASSLRWVVKEEVEELPLTGMTLKALALVGPGDAPAD